MKKSFYFIVFCIIGMLSTSFVLAQAGDKGQIPKADISKFLSHEESEAITNVSKGNSPRMTVFLVGRRETQERIISFNKSISKNNKVGVITKCRSVVEIPVGKRDSNTSYGGVCLYSEGSQLIPVSICNDKMVGHFLLTPLNFAINSSNGSISELINFTLNNCFGG